MTAIQTRRAYPPNWAEIAYEAKSAAAWRCERCQIRHGQIAVSARGNLYVARLAACHLDPEDTMNPDAELAVLCQSCHLRLDAFQHWRTRRRLARLALLHAGQRELL